MLNKYCCFVTQSCLTLRSHRLQHTRLLCSPLSQSLLKFMSIESVMLSNHVILCCLLLLPSVFPSIKVFYNWVGSSHQVAKVFELQLQQVLSVAQPKAVLNTMYLFLCRLHAIYPVSSCCWSSWYRRKHSGIVSILMIYEFHEYFLLEKFQSL